jgi:hypothetical protein
VHGFEAAETTQRPSAPTTDRKVGWPRYWHEQDFVVGIPTMVVGFDGGVKTMRFDRSRLR